MNETWFILGAGAIGTLVHAMCKTQGVNSCLLHHGNCEQQRNIKSNTREITLTAHPLASLDSDSITRLILTTKATDLAAAYRMANPWISEEASIIALANGLGWEQDVARHTFARGVSTAAAYRSSSNEVHWVATGATRIGLSSVEGSAALKNSPPLWFQDSLSKLPNWTWDEHIDAAIHHKFCLNCVINTLTAVYRCRNGELLTLTRERNALNMLCAELEPTVRSLGLWSADSTLLETVEEVCEATSGNQSSMLQDVLAGRQTENAYLGAELLRRAKTCNRHDPKQCELPKLRELVEKISAL